MSYIYFCIRWESEKRIQIEESGRTKKASNIGSSTVCDTLIFIFCSVGMKKKKGQKVCWDLNENNSFAGLQTLIRSMRRGIRKTNI